MHPSGAAAAAAVPTDRDAPEWAEGVQKSLFATHVDTPKLKLYERFTRIISTTRNELQSPECIQEVRRANEAVARFASSVSQFCDLMDQLWAQYDHEHRALTLFSSDGLNQNRYTAETRLPGSVVFAHLTPSTINRVNVPDNPPQSMPVPTRSRLASEGLVSPGVPLVLPPSVGLTSVTTTPDGQRIHRDPVSVDSLISMGESLASRVLGDFDHSAHLPGAEGDRALGPLVLNQLLRSVHDLIRLLGQVKSVWSQHRIQLLHIAEVTRTSALANRLADNGFAPLP